MTDKAEPVTKEAPKPRGRRGYGSVRKLRTGYQARGADDRSLGMYDTRDEAYAACADAAKDRRMGKTVNRKHAKVTVQEYAEQWLKRRAAGELDGRDLQPGTLQDYEKVIRTLVCREPEPGSRRSLGIGVRRMADVTEDEYRAWVRRIRDQVGGTSGRKARVLGSILFKQAVRDKVRSDNPAADAPYTGGRTDGRRTPHFLQVDEMVELVVSATKPIARDYISTLLWSGMRPEEVRALTPRALDPVRPVVVVFQTCVDLAKVGVTVQPTTKNHQHRPVRVPETVMGLLRARAEDLPADGFIFGGERSGKPKSDSNVNRDWWKPAVKASGLKGDPNARMPGRRNDLRPYDARATHVSLLLSAGVPQIEVQAQVGHESGSEVTGLYSLVQTWGEEDALVLALRGKGLSVGTILDTLHDQAWEAHGF